MHSFFYCPSCEKVLQETDSWLYCTNCAECRKSKAILVFINQWGEVSILKEDEIRTNIKNKLKEVK